MDFQALVDSMTAMTCVVSVEHFADGKYGKFRIVTGNKAYINSIEHPAPGTKMLTDKFVPNTEYTNYLTRDLNFEDYCYRAAVEKKCLHSYAHPDRMNVWFNMTFLPVGEDEGNLSYCLYIMEINFEADSTNLSNSVSSEVASSVLDTCIKLRGTNDFKSTMKDVITGIRDLCHAEHCCILVMNEYDRSCYVLGEAFREGTKLLPMEHYVDNAFYDIADSWKDTIAGSNCLIAKNEQDMEIVKERNPAWYESLTGAGAYNIVLFPLKSRGQLLGYMWSLNFDPSIAVKIKETLEVTTFILGSELGNYLLLDRLRLLGSRDMLTGVMNRNEMNNVVDDLAHGSDDDVSVGVIFADLNGLKTINDVNGHNAGDMLLKNAATVLRKVFDEKDIFRAGGDEFAIIVKGITKKELNEKIEMIRAKSEEYDDVSFALGGSVEKNSSNVRMALRHADEKMYEDKQKYYRKHPDRAEESRRSRQPMAQPVVLNEVSADESRIIREMNYDTLTDLPSMTNFLRLAEIGRKSMHDNNVESALLFINLNGLRFFNQRHGYSEGDALIKDFGRIIAAQFGNENCSRFGQDNFAVYTEAADVEKKLETVFRDAKTANGGKTLLVRCGIYPDSMGIVETTLAYDRARYACDSIRDNTKSYYNYFDKPMLQREINRKYVIDNLERAINENWITAFYQPIVRATSRKVCDEEALARWIDPKKGMMSPADFIPILEDTKQIYKVDLHIVDIILERIKKQKESGLGNVVPISVNLSRTDFECCDIVSEINNRVEAAGIPKNLLTIEITESVVGENFDFMKEQIEHFQNLGFSVWMDDFGSGYSSLDLLQELQFDLIKFDMRFMRQFETTPKSRVILTELMRMAVSLNIETVCEGVETAEQVEFLSEIGCTRMQGYYFCKPVSFKQIQERYEKGEQIGFEDSREADYHKTISSINLYDLGAISSEESESIKHYFNTIPMAVVESFEDGIRVIRCNKTYHEFSENYPKMEGAISAGASQCESVGQRVFLTEPSGNGETVNILIRRIVDNPVNDVAAFAVAVLDITMSDDQTLTYTGVARALSADFIDLYHVDLETEKFTQYSSDGENGEITVKRSGDDFFATSRMDAMEYLYGDDQISFVREFTKENVIRCLDKYGVFIHLYRLFIDDRPQYVNMKAVRLENDSNRIIVAVSNVDFQMKQQEELERLEEEALTYSRMSVLIGDFIVMYTVDPDSGNYMEYRASEEFSNLGTPKAGTDFFAESREQIRNSIAPEDYDKFMQEFTKERILYKTLRGEVFEIDYRLMLGGEPVKVNLRAGVIQEKDGPQLIVGVAKV